MDVALCASNFSGYGSGILKKTDGCCTGLNHAVTIVGCKLCPEDDGNDGNDGDDGNDGNDGDGNDGDGDGDGDITPSACTVDKWWYSCQDETA